LYQLATCARQPTAGKYPLEAQKMFAIQWYDLYDLTPSGIARKDGKPKGSLMKHVNAMAVIFLGAS
jgi:hypothetical protein